MTTPTQAQIEALLSEINKCRNHGGVDAYTSDVLRRCYKALTAAAEVGNPADDIPITFGGNKKLGIAGPVKVGINIVAKLMTL